ncbi:hypothetical protein [Deinococcus sedimenti]|uniref:Uncharacterized protein n=1 Tax=Deinococcus sedimenti TaxID=1867090 RepID=A0ABQ2SAA5_9DEIO|nr:hypothetical protein [Deinococcus sedimenti]GGS04378.1 hypothetical protein GCM10008960_33760 [Deinococcus sedimenti]
MALPGKLLLSALLVLLTLLGLYVSAYAFSVPRALLHAGRVAGCGGALMGLLIIWRAPGPWLWYALPCCLLAAALLIWLVGGA